MANGIKTSDPCGSSSKFFEDYRVWEIPEEGRRAYQQKRCGNNNKDEDNSPKTLNDKNTWSVLEMHKLYDAKQWMFPLLIYYFF